MITRAPHSVDVVAWAKRVNSRWIVHHGLGETAAEYLDYLSQMDPGRLVRSCSHARILSEEHGHTEDPKPWFYAGLFSLATADEAKRFLDRHPFTASSLPGLAGESDFAGKLSAASEETRNKIIRIREAAQRLLANPGREGSFEPQ